MTRKILIFPLFLFCQAPISAASTEISPYERPRLTTFLTRQPGDLKEFFHVTFRKETLPTAAVLAASTGLLIIYDQRLYDKTYALGDQWGISHEGQQHSVVKVNNPFVGGKKLSLLGMPRNVGTALYFLGDGWFHGAITASFLAYGLAASDNRALRTSSQLAEAILADGIVVQTLKHLTGRENPDTLTAPGGKWRFFPNQKDYHKHVNKYDAFPSGHLPTALITVTVIAENYPECKFVYPLGYALMGGLAFQMVNNGVHWWSDYPLALYLGYSFAHIAVNGGRAAPGAGRLGLMPIMAEGRAGAGIYYRF